MPRQAGSRRPVRRLCSRFAGFAHRCRAHLPGLRCRKHGWRNMRTLPTEAAAVRAALGFGWLRTARQQYAARLQTSGRPAYAAAFVYPDGRASAAVGGAGAGRLRFGDAAKQGAAASARLQSKRRTGRSVGKTIQPARAAAHGGVQTASSTAKHPKAQRAPPQP